MQSGKLKTFAHQPPVVLAALLLTVIVGFYAVHHLVNNFEARQTAIAQQMWGNGLNASKAGDALKAISYFRAALALDPSNYDYELALAEALSMAGRFSEADTYLLDLWERAPQDGNVNLQLARAAARDGRISDAVRYYHNAIYGIWRNDPDQSRRRTRLELVDLLLDQKDRLRAQSELIASAAGLPADPALHLKIASYLMRAQDYQDALDQSRIALRLDSKDVDAMTTAGRAAFQLGQFRMAERYLQAAFAAGTKEADVAQMLETTRLVLQNDPSAAGISDAERRRRAVAAFQQAGSRLQSCAQQQSIELDASGNNPLQALNEEWASLKAKVSSRAPAPDTIAAAMNLAFRIEEETGRLCGPPQGLDLALLLIGQDREGTGR